MTICRWCARPLGQCTIYHSDFAATTGFSLSIFMSPESPVFRQQWFVVSGSFQFSICISISTGEELRGVPVPVSDFANEPLQLI